MRNATITCVLAAALVPFATATVPMAAQAPFERIVAFGTSLSDSGNAFALRGGTNTPPDYLWIPFSSRVRRTREAVIISATGRPGLSSLRGQRVSQGRSGRHSPRPPEMRTNYAVGGARAYEDGININLGAQVDAFSAAVRRQCGAPTRCT